MRVIEEIDGSTTVNEVVLRAPWALPVLSRYGIDSCCGGPLQLAEAARRHGHPLEEVLAALAAAAPGASSSAAAAGPASS
jgi:iron-sulfur cluster repair protein YtfE (RIC family)